MGRTTIKLIAVFTLLMGAFTFAAPASVQVVQASNGKVLILDSTVAGGTASREYLAVQAAGKVPELINGAGWSAKTTADFAAYDAIVLGDRRCSGVGDVAAADANTSVWGPAVTGKVLINGTDPVYHYYAGKPGGDTLVSSGIAFAVSDPGKTGAYISLSCYYHSASPNTPVTVLNGLAGPAAFTVKSAACYNDAHIVATSPALTGLTDASLSNWYCSVHEEFDKWPASFEVLAIARGSGTSFNASDGTVGTPYILARGVTVISAIQLAPASGTSPVGTPYTLTATAKEGGTSVVGATVTFTVVSGPNAGKTATGTTGSSGQATFTYTSATTGTDFVKASFVDSLGHTQSSGNASVDWTKVVEQPITAAGTTVNAVEGQSVSGTVATFNDPDTAASEYSASIDWGDGTAASPGTIAATGGGNFTLSGSHTYAEEGKFSVSVAITDNDSANSAKATSPAVVVDAALTAGKTATVSSTEGQSFTGPVATFTDANATAPASEFTATITWGDGSPDSTGTVSGSGGSYTVAGTHIYKEEGPFTGSVKIVDQGGSTTMTSFTATIKDAALTATAVCPTTTLQAINGPVATFTDAASPSGTLSDFTATIDWGDGTTSAGTVSGPSGGLYTVSGSHTYTSTGYFTITTSIKDVGGSTATTTCKTLVYAFAPGGGSFVIGDKNAANGTAVTFWGAQWAKDNTLSGGSAPSSFTGFAESPKAPTKGTTWGTDPGNSTPPPSGALPAYMGVIVTSAADKSGAAISGNIVHIVIVQTNPGYAGNPGHAGTGTVVAQVS